MSIRPLLLSAAAVPVVAEAMPLLLICRKLLLVGVPLIVSSKGSGVPRGVASP